MESRHAEIFKKRYNDAVLKTNINGEEMETRRLQFIQNLTETVTINGRPLAHLYDSGTCENWNELQMNINTNSKP